MADLKDDISFEELTVPLASASDAHYEAWKADKIRAALKQSRDRSVMVPANKVWERFGFER